jgi:hypothetical protein
MEMTEYVRIHAEVRRRCGRADMWACDNECGEQARDWSHIHDTDPTDWRNYIPLCRRCHRQYDGLVARKPVPDKDVAEMKRLRATGMSYKTIGLQLGYAMSTVHRYTVDVEVPQDGRRRPYDRVMGRR